MQAVPEVETGDPLKLEEGRNTFRPIVTEVVCVVQYCEVYGSGRGRDIAKDGGRYSRVQ